MSHRISERQAPPGEAHGARLLSLNVLNRNFGRIVASLIVAPLAGALATLAAQAQDAGSITVLDRHTVAFERADDDGRAPSGELRLTLAYLDGSGWAADTIVAAIAQSARILRQCGVSLRQTELVRISAPDRYRHFQTQLSRELARTLPLPKPTIYFVAGTRQRPAFDAEAIGRANSRTRLELADTVWVTYGTRDLAIAIAHELAHVLMDSGEHSDDPRNLMRADTTPERTQLTDAQCARLRGTAIANGLLQPLR